jgi:hypothetical protein
MPSLFSSTTIFRLRIVARRRHYGIERRLSDIQSNAVFVKDFSPELEADANNGRQRSFFIGRAARASIGRKERRSNRRGLSVLRSLTFHLRPNR